MRVAPKLFVTDGINATRTLFPQCRFDAVKCADGLQALRHYQWGPLTSNGAEPRAPLHNWASHGADALRTCATSIRHAERPVEMVRGPSRPHTPYGWMG